MNRTDGKTATPEDSIWREIPEETFRSHLVALEEMTNAIPIDPEIFNIKDWSGAAGNSNATHILPLEVEQKFADDFAYLATIEQGAHTVSAVCIEENVEPPRITLQIAGCDISLHDGVKASLRTLIALLPVALTHSGDVSVHETFFHQVIQLHASRIIARLRSSKWAKPKYLSKSHKKPLWQDFSNTMHRAQFMYTKKEKALRLCVEGLLDGLRSRYSAFEAITEDEHLHLINLVKATYEFCSKEEIKNFLWRLEKSVNLKPTPQVASAIKCIRQTQKVAAYYRICSSMLRTARDYPMLFRTPPKLEFLTPYTGFPTSIGYEEWAKTCHVHGEVQLAVYYDLLFSQSPQKFLPPRCIGISKWLCFLCYRFLVFHQHFFPSKTHGRLYDQWTIPDLVEFGPALAHRYRNIVKGMDEEIQRRTQAEPGPHRLEPMTSIEVYGDEP